jgi:hypothetical protein
MDRIVGEPFAKALHSTANMRKPGEFSGSLNSDLALTDTAASETLHSEGLQYSHDDESGLYEGRNAVSTYFALLVFQ